MVATTVKSASIIFFLRAPTNEMKQVQIFSSRSTISTAALDSKQIGDGTSRMCFPLRNTAMNSYTDTKLWRIYAYHRLSQP